MISGAFFPPLCMVAAKAPPCWFPTFSFVDSLPTETKLDITKSSQSAEERGLYVLIRPFKNAIVHQEFVVSIHCFIFLKMDKNMWNRECRSKV